MFNFGLLVVIYPLTNGLFRIQVFMKEQSMMIGPLMDEVTVTKACLPLLVRVTAQNASSLLRFSVKGYKHPFVARQDLLQECKCLSTCFSHVDFVVFFFTSLVQKHQQNNTFEGFMSQIFPSSDVSRTRSSSREPKEQANRSSGEYPTPLNSSIVTEKVEVQSPPPSSLTATNVAENTTGANSPPTSPTIVNITINFDFSKTN